MKKYFGVTRIKEELAFRIRDYCIKKDMKMSKFVNDACQEKLNKVLPC